MDRRVRTLAMLGAAVLGAAPSEALADVGPNLGPNGGAVLAGGLGLLCCALLFIVIVVALSIWGLVRLSKKRKLEHQTAPGPAAPATDVPPADGDEQ